MFLMYFCSPFSDLYTFLKALFLLYVWFFLIHRQKKLEKAMDEEGLPDDEVRYALSSPLQTSTCCRHLQMSHCLSACVSQKVMRRSQHARKETEFLRLKRTRLGLDDFESLKVIGRGAFGEVR